MTDRPPLARAATDVLVGESIPDVRPSPAARNDAIAAIAGALVARKQAARRRRVLGGVALGVAAAAAAVFVVGTRHPASRLAVEGSARVVHDGAPVSSPAALSAGDHVLASNGGSVVLASGTRLVLEGNSDLAVASAGKSTIFDVRTGSVRFDVAKLAADDRFIVRTVDSEVEVRGTVFSVSIASPEARCGSTPTRVAVREGVVVVRHAGAETRLLAGDSWPKCEPALPAPPPTVATPAPVAETPAPAVVVSPTPTQQIAPKPPPTDLAAQNDVFAEGIAKKRSGDQEGAIATFDRLLTKWPGSPLAENAAAERMRLATGDRAVAYAKAYLARFPNGFAAKEARTISSTP